MTTVTRTNAKAPFIPTADLVALAFASADRGRFTSTCVNCDATIVIEDNRWVDTTEGGTYDWCPTMAGQAHKAVKA